MSKVKVGQVTSQEKFKEKLYRQGVNRDVPDNSTNIWSTEFPEMSAGLSRITVSEIRLFPEDGPVAGCKLSF